MDETLCRATRADGEPCTVRALADGYCFAHSPQTAQKRRAAYAAGGRTKSRAARIAKLVPASLRPLLEQLLAGVEEVHSGQLAPAQAGAMASLANAVVKIFETCELTERLERLERGEALGDHDQAGYPRDPAH